MTLKQPDHELAILRVGDPETLPDGRRFPAWAEVQVSWPARPKWPVLSLRLETQAGRPVATQLVVASPPLAEVTGTWFRSLPLNEIIHDAIRAAASNAVLREAFEAGQLIDADGRMVTSVGEGLEGARQLAQDRRRPITPELLAQVAEVYRSDTTGRPTEAVKNAVPTSYRTATRLIARAREAGLLEPYRKDT